MFSVGRMMMSKSHQGKGALKDYHVPVKTMSEFRTNLERIGDVFYEFEDNGMLLYDNHLGCPMASWNSYERIFPLGCSLAFVPTSLYRKNE